MPRTTITRTRRRTATLSVPLLATSLHEELKNAKTVFDYALKSVNKFYATYQKERRGSAGSTSHQEQDLLRAMLVFSCSGLDAVVKQLIKDALPKIIEKEKGAQKEFQKYVERRLRKTSSEEKEKIISIDTELLSQILVSQTPQLLLTERLTQHLTDDSLQNKDQLLKVAAYFAITAGQVLNDPETTKLAFEARNEIVHEMDVNFESQGTGQRKRHQRPKDTVLKFCKNIFTIGSQFVNVVSQKLD